LIAALKKQEFSPPPPPPADAYTEPVSRSGSIIRGYTWPWYSHR